VGTKSARGVARFVADAMVTGQVVCPSGFLAAYPTHLPAQGTRSTFRLPRVSYVYLDPSPEAICGTSSSRSCHVSRVVLQKVARTGPVAKLRFLTAACATMPVATVPCMVGGPPDRTVTFISTGRSMGREAMRWCLYSP